MPMLRSRCPQDNARASRHDPVSVAVPILDTGVLQEAHAQTFLSSPISAAVRWCRGAFTALQRPRRASLLYWYRWLKKRHLLCYAAVTFFFLLLITLLFISFAAIALTWDRPWTQILVQEYLSFQADSFHVRVPGAVQPREPARLWGLTVAPAQPLASPLPEHADRAAQEDYASRVKARLERQYGASLFLYTFVNGTEPNHVYRRLSLGYCGNHIQSVEMQLALNGAVLDGKGTAELCTTPMQRAKTNAEVLAMVDGRAMATTTGRDRETDELRHSIRSVEQHVPWHRGRVVIVSPGHHPTWVDGAKNFLAGACGDASVQALRTRGTHLRLTTVHQDAVMPYGMRLTANSHVIEQHLWRVRNITPVHVYMNDDYFVNRDVAITDLFNEYGGTIVRTEASQIRKAVAGDESASWAQGVANTELFNIQELDVQREDYLPENLIKLWEELNRVENSTAAPGALLSIAEPPLGQAVDVAHHYSPEPLPTVSLKPRRCRRYATHAPFVYCTNMFRYFETRYEREFSFNGLHHRGRRARDLFIPFVYNAFIMARPWVASPQFLPYLLQLHRSRGIGDVEMTPVLNISLDNFDGCAPSTMLSEAHANGCLYGKFSDDVAENKEMMQRIAQRNPLYFNINAGFRSAEASEQLRRFLHDSFPTPIYLERTAATGAASLMAAASGGDEANASATAAASAAADASLTPLFDALMQLPVVGVVSYEEGACPLVRSLSLAFAGHHRGRVHVAVQRPGGGDASETLREARTRLKHRVFSATPVPRCAYGPQVTAGPVWRCR